MYSLFSLVDGEHEDGEDEVHHKDANCDVGGNGHSGEDLYSGFHASKAFIGKLERLVDAFLEGVELE
jgi:hypothetical protein